MGVGLIHVVDLIVNDRMVMPVAQSPNLDCLRYGLPSPEREESR